MSPTRPGLFERLRRFLGLRKDPPAPPDSFVREPRRPTPSSSGGAATIELPETETEDRG